MPQVFQVLRCFKCLFFQVHLTKKANKFFCKMCGEKQSIKRHYGLGTGQECRLHVQKLNGIRGELDELNDGTKSNNDSEEDPSLETPPINTLTKGKSKWSNFIEGDTDVNEPKPEDTMYLGNAEVVLEVPTKKRRFTKPKPAIKNEKYQTQNDYCDENTCSVQNKTDKYGDMFSSPIEDDFILKRKPTVENVVTNIPKEKVKKVFKSPKINQKSKWAQFTENDVENEDYLEESDCYINVNDSCLKENDDGEMFVKEFHGIQTDSNITSKKEQHCEAISESESDIQKTNVNEFKINIFSTYDENELDNILNV